MSFTRNGEVRLAQGPLPDPAPREVRVKTICSAISPGTELAQLRNEFTWWRKPDRCPGYSAVVVVDAVGNQVQDPQPGQVLYTQTPHSSVALMDPAKDVWAPVPTGLNFESAALTTLLAIGLYGVRKARLTLGTPTLVLGDGPIGLAATFFCHRAGSWPTILAGHHARRLALAADSFGATSVLNTRETPLAQAVRSGSYPKEVEVVINATRSPAAFRDACAVCAPGGRVVLLGTFAQQIVFHPWHDAVQSKGLSLGFTHQPLNDPAARLRDRVLILEWLAAGEVPAAKFITDSLPYTQAAEAYHLLKAKRDEAICIILDWTREE